MVGGACLLVELASHRHSKAVQCKGLRAKQEERCVIECLGFDSIRNQ